MNIRTFVKKTDDISYVLFAGAGQYNILLTLCIVK